MSGSHRIQWALSHIQRAPKGEFISLAVADGKQQANAAQSPPSLDPVFPAYFRRILSKGIVLAFR